MAHIKSATVQVPDFWPVEANQSFVDLSEEKSIRVDANNPIHGVNPYTPQHECGEHGEYIHVTPYYLLNLHSPEMFVKMFAEFRFGAHSNHGYLGDPIYPLFIKKTINGVPKMVPNYGTDQPPKGMQL